jgi:general secretion pathway protein L
MARFVGIDISPTHVRAALVRSRMRAMVVERLLEVDRSHVETLEQALQTCVLPLLEHGEAMAVAVDGNEAFFHRLTLPASARKQIEEVLPFELEAQVPVEFDDLIHDFRIIPSRAPGKEIRLITAAAHAERVVGLVGLVRGALGREPERVGCGSLPLANLANVCPRLQEPGPIALVDVEADRTEVLILAGGALVAARTLSVGMQALPDDAQALSGQLRQTFAAWAASGGEAVSHVWLLGLGALDPKAPAYLSYTLGVITESITASAFTTDLPEGEPLLPRYAKAIALAAGLKNPRDLNLRKGGLTFERGYEFVKDKVPLLTGLAGSILISFLFATWAESRALSREHDMLTEALATVSQNVLGEETSDPEEALLALERGRTSTADPMPHADAFDLLVGISKAIPMEVTHDIEDFDLERTRRRVKIKGVVSSGADAQKVTKEIKKIRCVQNVKDPKITQVINSERKKYQLEFIFRCPEDEAKAKPKKPKGEESAKGGEG